MCLQLSLSSVFHQNAAVFFFFLDYCFFFFSTTNFESIVDLREEGWMAKQETGNLGGVNQSGALHRIMCTLRVHSPFIAILLPSL